MHPLVRNLYKRFLLVARDYPLPAQECKRRIRDGFRRNSHLTDDEAILRAVHHGRYKCREAIAVIQVKKYRQLKRQYEPTEAADGASSEQQQHRAASSGTA